MSFYTWEEVSGGNVHEDGEPPSVPGDLRASGVFSDPDDALEYLQRGGLAWTISDEGDIAVNPIVHVVKMYDVMFDEEFYQVWIAEDSSNPG
jgi:hypothetical protein